MTNVAAFPSPMSNSRTPVAVEVIIAPLADMWCAWLRLPNGRFVALERTPAEEHALADARAYAGRYGIPVSVLRRPLAVMLDRSAPSQRRRNEISIWPDREPGCCWQIDHTGASGNSVGIVGSASSLDEAVRIARDAAQRLGATFDEAGAA